jgi:hypothetical protein
MDARVVDSLQTVHATLNYLARDSQRPFAYTYEPPIGTPWRLGKTHVVEGVPIRNARPLASELCLAEQGFELREHRSAVTNFYYAAQIRDVYEPEVEALLKAATGAEKVVMFDHTIRSVCEARVEGRCEPVGRVYNDYTAKSARRRVRDHLPPAEAEERLRRHFYEVNVWRPITGPIEDAPLALCDARTIALEDLIPTDLIYRDRIGEIYSVAYNPAHHWFYFPRLARGEVILIKCFDSDEASPGRFTAHTAFDDPTTPADARLRESIETRALVFFAD